jgi:hypothetical protein
MINKTIYRVHVEGLRPTERTVFGGVIHLAESHGTYFQIETAIENSDVYIRDGSDLRGLELGRSNTQISQRTVWIDPPAGQDSVRKVTRPLRWGYLLEMMEQIVGTKHVTPTALPNLPSIKPTFDQLCSVSQNILRMHIGIAAEFVVEDVRAEILKAGDSQEENMSTVFLETLKKQLPANADAEKIILEISNALARSGAG